MNESGLGAVLRGRPFTNGDAPGVSVRKRLTKRAEILAAGVDLWAR
jgi:hypothetical protein